MSENASQKTHASTPPALTVCRLAALFTVLTVAMGAVVCATSSGAACPTWPGCRPGNIAPEWQLSPLIEFTHCVIAIATGPLVLAAAVMSRRLPGPDRLVRILPWVALVGAMGSAFFGRLVVVGHLSTPLGGVDLFCALTAMTATGITAVRAGRACRQDGAPHTAAAESAACRAARAAGREMVLGRRLAAAAVGAVIAMHVTGIFTAGVGSYTRCMGWPLWQIIDGDLHPWLQATRLGVAGLAAVLVVATAAVVARHEPLRAWGLTIAALFAVEMVLGLMLRAGDRGLDVATAYSVVAVALLWSLGLLTAVAGPVRVGAEVAPPAPEPALN